MNRPDHARAIRERLTDARKLCGELGLLEGHKRQTGGVIIRCPSHKEKTASCSVRLGPDRTLAVRCHACDFTGDALTLIATLRGLDVHRPDDFRKVLDEGAELARYDLHNDDSSRPPRAPRPPPPSYPHAEDVAALWALAQPLSNDMEAVTYLTGRALDVATIERLDLARLLPHGVAVPAWARCGLPWPASGHRLLLPVYNASGAICSLRAWRLDGQDPKRVAPAGYSTAGLVLANAAGRELLATGTTNVDLVVVEGEPDFLTWSIASEGRAVLGIVAHAWTIGLAARVPDGVRVALRVHRDGAGDKYAAALQSSFSDRCELHDFPRPSQRKHRDENETQQAGELPADPFDGLSHRKDDGEQFSHDKAPTGGDRRTGQRRETPDRREKDGRPPVDTRPFIEITTDLHLVIDAAIAALAAVGNLNLYVRDAALVQVLRSTETEKGRRDAGAPLVRPLQIATLRELLTKTATWGKYDGRTGGVVHCVPNDHTVAGTFCRGQWLGLRSLVGVLETPFLRPDGTVCQTPGFDEKTGYLLVSTDVFPEVLDTPTQEQSSAALVELRTELFSDFPFVSEVDRHVPIAALLTLLARPAIGRGNTPAFLFDANNRGTGKGLLTNALCLVATGRVAPKTGYPIDDGEMGKLLGGVARDACAILSFDNIDTAFGGGSIERALTCEGSMHFRILGLTATQTSTWRTVVRNVSMTLRQ